VSLHRGRSRGIRSAELAPRRCVSSAHRRGMQRCLPAISGRTDRRMSPRDDLHVVLGTGPLGLAVIRHLSQAGPTVRAVNRSVSRDVPAGVGSVSADVSVRHEAERACAGAAIVYHCASPPYASGRSYTPHSWRGHRRSGCGRGTARLWRQPVRVRSRGGPVTRGPSLPRNRHERSHASADRRAAHAGP